MKKVGLFVAGLMLLVSILACSTPATNAPAPAQAEELSEEAQRVLSVATPTNTPTVTEEIFRSSMFSVCSDTIEWWNSDVAEGGDISGGKNECENALVDSFCDSGTCQWPGPWGNPSDGWDAANKALKAVAPFASNPGIYPQDRFTNKFMEFLSAERVSIGIAP